MSSYSFKSFNWSDFFLYTLIDPRQLYKNILESELKTYKLSFAVPAIVSITNIIAMSLLGNETSFFFYKVSYGWILFFLLWVLRNVVSSSLMDLISQFMGYKGKVKDMISLLNFSIFPHALLLPIIYIFKVLNFAPLFFYIFITFLLFIWSAFITILGISEMHSINFPRAILIYVFPYLFVWILIFFVVVLLFILGAGFFF